MGTASWESRGFRNADVVCLYTNNKEALNHNNRNMLKVGNLIASVESENAGNAKSMSDETFSNLLPSMHLCIGMEVMLTRNHLNAGLLNRSIGIVKEIVCENDKLVSALPKFIMIDFRESCTSKSFSYTI